MTKKRSKVAVPVERSDSFFSTNSNLGSIHDKSTGLIYVWRRQLTEDALNAMYVQNGIIARIVDLKVQDAFRTPWKIADCDVQLDHKQIMSDMDDLRVNSSLIKGWQWGNLYGGAGIVLPVRDGRKPRMRMDLGNIVQMYPLQVVAARNCLPYEMDSAFGSPTYQQIISYDVTGLTTRRGSVRVHHSRIIPIEPIELPTDLAARISYGNHGWGPSIIERVYEALGWAGSSKQHAIAMMYIASILYLKIHGYRDAHKGKEGKKLIRELLAETRKNLDALGILGLDSADELGSLTLSITGAHELIDRMENAIVAYQEMPREIVLNESPAGLNAGQLSGPQEIWFHKVQAFREQRVTPQLDRVLEVYFAWRGIPAREWKIEWEPLWTRSENELADIASKNAATDESLWRTGAASADEIRHHRLVLGRLDPLRVDEGETDDLPPLDLASEVAAQQQATAPAPEVTTPADTAMNGPQIASMMEIVQNVAAGLLPRDSAIGIIGAAFPSLRGREEAILGSAGLGLPPLAAGPAVPGGPPVAAGAPDEASEPVQAAYEPPPGEPLMTAQEIHAQLGVSPASLKSMRQRGEIGAWQFGGRWRFAKSEVLQASHRPKPEAEDGDEA